MTPAQLRILKTLPKVIEAVRAFQAEADELRGLLVDERGTVAAVVREYAGPPTPPVPTLARATDPGAAEARAAAETELARRQAGATPEQKEAEAFLRNQEAPRRALLAAAGITP